MTTWPQRQKICVTAYQSILQQEHSEPVHYVLVLSSEEFAKDDDLMAEMERLGVEVIWDKGNIISHKKLMPTLECYPDNPILVVDDDQQQREGWLQAFIDEQGEESGIKEIGGAYVASVDPEGAASAAGIRKGDVIMSINGVKINDRATLSEQIGKHRPNDKVKISVKRGDDMKHFEVTLRNKAGKAELISKDDVDVEQALGGKFAAVNERAMRELDIKGGLQVVQIKQGGLLAKARVREGFVITHINDRQVRSVNDLSKINEKIASIDGIYPNGRAASYTFVE